MTKKLKFIKRENLIFHIRNNKEENKKKMNENENLINTFLFRKMIYFQVAVKQKKIEFQLTHFVLNSAESI
jgi:uncharacterized membrane protein